MHLPTRAFTFVASAVLVVAQMILGGAGLALADDTINVSKLLVPGGASAAGARPASLTKLNGPVDLWVRLSDPPLASAFGDDGKQKGGRLSGNEQRAYVRDLNAKQDGLMSQLRGLGAVELGRVAKALNAVAIRVDASQIPTISALPNVTTVRAVGTYELSLSETVPYIGATTVQNTGTNGTGVTVAVLDSGIDYTHRSFGGPGTAPAYTAAYGTSIADARNTTRGGLFPTAKVVGGFDFVGERWPSIAGVAQPLAPDPDPIDCGPATIPAPCAGGHGTHVADIIAGNDGATHKGVAPGARLLAVKVCSSVSTSCSGIALLQGMDFSLDPNGDGDISDAADVVNMSLGSNYGQREDDLSEASANAVRLGVVVVAAAGNAADRPYIVSSPSSTPEVISVAQTQVPSAKAFSLRINSPATIAGDYKNTASVDWAPVNSAVTGNVAFVGRGCPANSIAPANNNPADTYLADPNGKVALIDRGGCSVSLKVDRAVIAGATAVLIGLVAPGDASTFAYGGGTNFKPTLVITQATANLIKANIGAPVNVTISPAIATALVGSMVGSSARGPSYSYNAIKPDIGAPGASVSADAGSGTGESGFGGTSGATPMVAGSAALLIQRYPGRSPAEIKAVLMNTAETDIKINPATQPGVLAPITSIGGGEVRVDRAFRSNTAAWDADTRAGSVSFGYHTVNESETLEREVVVHNYSSSSRTYAIARAFRYTDDAASGAVGIDAPNSITVAGNSSRSFKVKLTIDASRLPTWNLNGGSQGGNGALLQGVEFDGYIALTSGTESVHMAWQVLPHRAAAVKPQGDQLEFKKGVASLNLSNKDGAIAGRVEAFALTGESKQIKKKNLPQPGDNFAIIDLRSVGVRQADTAIQFGINTYGERAHPNYPAEFDIYIDSNNDGTFDYVVFNLENGGFGATGQNVVAVANLTTGVTSINFFADADLDSANMIMTAPLAAVGLTPASKFRFSIFAFDNYFTGALTDSVENMTHTLGTPKFAVSGVPIGGVPAGGSSRLTVTQVTGGDTASPSQTGVLLLYRDGRLGHEADAIKADNGDQQGDHNN
jgi:subtilisin family serine protease